MDDIFAVFPHDTSCTNFFDLLNAQHKHIKSTVEHAPETIPFHDVKVKLTDSGLDAWVWRKPTHTILLYQSVLPAKMKIGFDSMFIKSSQRNMSQR